MIWPIHGEKSMIDYTDGISLAHHQPPIRREMGEMKEMAEYGGPRSADPLQDERDLEIRSMRI